MSETGWPIIEATTTTDDVPPSVDFALIRAHRSETGWLVTDYVTTRFGYAATFAEAFAAWLDQLREIAALEGPLGPPIAREAEWARGVLAEERHP